MTRTAPGIRSDRRACYWTKSEIRQILMSRNYRIRMLIFALVLNFLLNELSVKTFEISCDFCFEVTSSLETSLVWAQFHAFKLCPHGSSRLDMAKSWPEQSLETSQNDRRLLFSFSRKGIAYFVFHLQSKASCQPKYLFSTSVFNSIQAQEAGF